MAAASRPVRTPGWVVATLCTGTTLSALNSGMIAVALATLRGDFGIDVATVTWVITVFYLTSAALQPLMGRLADRYGARRVFRIGMGIVIVAGAAGPFAPDFAWVCAARVLLAIGVATAFPAAAALLRAYAADAARRGGPAVNAGKLIGRVQLIDTSAAAIGPVVGGVLITVSGWGAIFWVNVPLALVALVGTGILLSPDPPGARVSLRQTIADADVPGILLFVVTIAGLVAFVLEAPDEPLWWLLPVVPIAGALFVWRELRCADPFIDLRMLRANSALLRVYAHFFLASLVFYSALFGLPQYLEDHAHYRPAAVGALLLPLAAFTVLLAPFVEKRIDRRGLRPVLVTGGVLLLVATFGLPILTVTTLPVAVVLAAAAVGVAYGVVLVSVTQSLDAAAPAGHVGQAAGLFQTARALGGIGATAVVGVSFAGGTGPADWLALTIAIIVSAAIYVCAVIWLGRSHDARAAAES